MSKLIVSLTHQNFQQFPAGEFEFILITTNNVGVKKLFKNFRKPLVFIPAILFILIAVPVLAYFLTANRAPDEIFTVKRTNIAQELGITGSVKPAENVDLAFEKGGRIIKIYAKVGDKVVGGQILAALENSEATAEIARAEADVAMENAKLNELLKGTRPEELSVQETKVSNLKIAREDALRNLADKVEDAYTKSDDAVRSKTDQFFDDPFSANPQLQFFVSVPGIETDIESGRISVEAILKNWRNELEQLNLNGNFSDYEIDAKNNLDLIKSFLDKVALAVNSAEKKSNGQDLPQTTLLGWRADVATGRANINAAISNLTAAEEKLKNTESDLRFAESELFLKKSGTPEEQIAAQKAQTQKAEANADYYRSQLAKTIIQSPINGIITKKDAEVGEIVSANAPVLSVISQNKFEIEANIPEADVARIKIGNSASVILDAYGDEAVFEARIIGIDPAETISGGVPTYKATFQFSREDERIKSGMTANIRILTTNLQNAISLPQRAIILRNGKKIVYLLSEGKKIKEVEIKTGLKGTDGNIQILSGVKENDTIVIRKLK